MALPPPHHRRLLFDPFGCDRPPCFPPPPPSPDDSILIHVHNDHHHRIRNILVSVAAALLLLSCLIFFFLLRLRRRRHRNQQQQQQHHPDHPNPNPNLISDDDDDDDEGADLEAHHVWLIRTVGLDDPKISSIPTRIYYKSEQEDKQLLGDCTVCLGEFEDGDAIKILPKCVHPFHVSCIDTWLRSHVSCPLCRAPVVVTAVAGEGDVEEGLGPSEISHDQNNGVPVDLASGSSSSSSNLSLEGAVQPTRRSVSMDSATMGALMRRVGDGELEEGRKEVVVAKKKGKGVDVCTGEKNVEMKRSVSTRSGRYLFSKYRRGRSTSVIPL